MGRILLIVFGTFYRTIYYFTKILIYSHQKNKDYDKTFQLIKKASINSIKTARVSMEVEGLENIPKEDGFIYYPNHQGLFDVLMFFASSPRCFSFVIKKEAQSQILWDNGFRTYLFLLTSNSLRKKYSSSRYP